MNGSNSTTYAYTDGNHELNKITPPTGRSLQPESVTYDGFGRVAAVTSGAGNQEGFSEKPNSRTTIPSTRIGRCVRSGRSYLFPRGL
jgi:YD repeat-containing protein